LSNLTDQILVMLKMQESMNLKVHSNWREQAFEWYRAIWVECAEMLDHYGWKWWKKQEADMPQVHLELVDIFHFGLSAKLMENDNLEELSNEISTAISHQENHTDFKLALEALAEHTLRFKEFNMSIFASCLTLSELSTDDLYKQYVGKNTLNFFRQDHGYQDGSYKKIWNGKEDNEYLVDIVADLSPDLADFQEQVYQQLEQNYPD